MCGGALLVGLLAGCGGSDAAKAPVQHKDFAFTGRHLTIVADESSLQLEPADVTEIEVSRQVDGWVAFGHGPDPRWSLDGSTLRLQVRCSGLVSDCAARHVVKVPRGVGVTVRDADGSLKASGFRAGFSATSDNGAITVRDISGGSLDLRTANGNVDTSGIAADRVTARSDNGKISLNLVAAPGSLDAESSNGRVDIALPRGSYAVDAASRNGHTTVDVPRDGSSGHTVTARTDNGDITVRTAR